MPLETRNIWLIGHQSTGVSDLHRKRINRGQSVAGREFTDSLTVNKEYALGTDEKPFGLLFGSRVERGWKVGGGLDVLNLQYQAQRGGCRLQCLYL